MSGICSRVELICSSVWPAAPSQMGCPAVRRPWQPGADRTCPFWKSDKLRRRVIVPLALSRGERLKGKRCLGALWNSDTRGGQICAGSLWGRVYLTRTSRRQLEPSAARSSLPFCSAVVCFGCRRRVFLAGRSLLFRAPTTVGLFMFHGPIKRTTDMPGRSVARATASRKL